MSLYAGLGGFDAILGICVRWHQLCLADPEAAHPFEQDLHPQHDERLAAYLAEATGGPALYTGGYGTESSMQRVHAGNGVHPDLDEACLRLFDQAVAESGVPENAGTRLCGYFRAVTEGMRAYGGSEDDVPDGLRITTALSREVSALDIEGPLGGLVGKAECSSVVWLGDFDDVQRVGE